jgi:site-specific DNA-methyltransferase (adenine-specific)
MVISEVYNIDNMAYMATCKDKQFDLAIVDPEYGIGFSSYERGSSGIKVKERYTKNGKKTWDSKTPPPIYFSELFRISKNQIICGGNYFNLPPTQCFVFWYKRNPVPNFADGEYIWTSFKRPALCFDYQYYGNIEGDTNRKDITIVPTQKPVQLYKWLLKNYAKPGDKIFDSHMGSQSSRIACYEGGFDYWGCELDKEYFDAGCKRFEIYKQQLKLF